MAHQEELQPFANFGLGLLPSMRNQGGVFILAVYRDGSLTAAAHATDRGAMEAAVEYLEDELDEEGERGTLEDRFARAQGMIADEGGLLEIIPSPVHGS